MKIKSYKIVLLGIAIILLGIYASQWMSRGQVIFTPIAIFPHRTYEIKSMLSMFAPYIGIIIVIIGLLKKDDIEDDTEEGDETDDNE